MIISLLWKRHMKLLDLYSRNINIFFSPFNVCGNVPFISLQCNVGKHYTILNAYIYFSPFLPLPPPSLSFTFSLLSLSLSHLISFTFIHIRLSLLRLVVYFLEVKRRKKGAVIKNCHLPLTLCKLTREHYCRARGWRKGC